MAASDAAPQPKRGFAYRVTFPLMDETGALVSGAVTDSEVSLDGGAFADCTNEAVEIGASGMYYLDLTALEMDADTVALIIKSATAQTTPLVFYPGVLDVNVETMDAGVIDAIADAVNAGSGGGGVGAGYSGSTFVAPGAMFTGLLGHYATVTRRVYGLGSLDRFGQPASAVQEKRYEGIPCRLDLQSGDEPHDLERSSVSVPSVKLFLSGAFPVSEADEVSEVYDASGTLIAERLLVDHVKRVAGYDGRLHHYELTCKVLRTATELTQGGAPRGV